jgi:hypothetical protein
MPIYPSELPYRPDLNSFRIMEAFAPPVWTEFEDGPALGRKSRVGERAMMAYRIAFREVWMYRRFADFVRRELANGTLRFDMPVYIPPTVGGVADNYEIKEVQISRGTYTTEPFGTSFSVSFTLIVYDWTW